ncbi:putative cytosolic iron-sulfur protein assembly protein CIAO1 [Smittium culicis]|uniref:Putative cytosolic iron-sulfur protein assembly protein CIAO1 n=1 Tax=Smittium culicis TaxID=133412 RepID=A0A1R1YMM2_9FUNG|nr:putative cytosolic iron-sulfur protein assembly protein CIAO1 [Smittium culicis]
MILWHPVQDILVSCSYDDTIRIWRESEDDWYSSAVLSGHSSTVWAVDFDPTGNYIASCSEDLTIKIWTCKDSSNSKDVGFSTDSDWDCIFTVPAGAHSRAIYSISWSKHYPQPKITSINEDGSILVHNGYISTGSGDNSICIFKVTSQLLPKKTELATPLLSEGSSITLNEFNLVKMDVELVTKVENAHMSYDINSVSWNPNPDYSGLLTSAGDDDNARIWNFEKK